MAISVTPSRPPDPPQTGEVRSAEKEEERDPTAFPALFTILQAAGAPVPLPDAAADPGAAPPAAADTARAAGGVPDG
ncbi:MAG: hypothetical protein D6739_01770, partial [Nitrospirae bacterium]